MPDSLGPVTINAAGSVTLDLPQGISHIDYQGVILWNTSGYILNIIPRYNEAGTITIPPSNGVQLANDWDYSIVAQVVNPNDGNTPVSGVFAGSIYYNNETLPPPPSINPTNIAAVVESGTITVTGTVDVSSGTIDIGNTPSVTVQSGTVDIGSGTVTVGSGNISISNTPTVNIASGQSVIISSGSVDIGNTPTVNIAANQVVQVTNEPSGQLTVAGTVDANVAGNVTIDAGTVNVQPVEGKLLASPVGPVVQAVNVDVTATALYITGPITANIWVQGGTSGAIYNTIFAGGGVPGYSNIGLWVCPINPAEDISYNVASYIGAGVAWSITEVFTGAVTLLSPAIDGGPNEVQLANPSGSSFTTTFDPSSEVVLIFAYDVAGSGGGLSNWPTVKTNLSNPNPNLFSARPISHAVDSGGHESTIWEIAVMPSIMADNPPEVQIEVIWQVSTTCYVSKRSRGSGLPTVATSWTVVVPQPAAGSNWSYTLPGPAKLVCASGAFVAYNYGTSYTRYPQIVLGDLGGGVQLFSTSSAIGNGTTLYFSAFLGTPKGLASPSYADNVTIPELPDVVLPGGSTISGSVPGLQAGDQWESLALTFSAV